MGGFCAKSRLLICPPKQLFAEVAIAAMVMAILNILHYTASPVHQGFFCNDDSIRLPYRPFTVKPDLLLGVTFAGTLLVGVAEVMKGKAWSRQVVQANSSNIQNSVLYNLWKKTLQAVNLNISRCG